MALTGPSTQKAHMSTQQPEALRLADELEAAPAFANSRGTINLEMSSSMAEEASTELRRLHAEVERLRKMVPGDVVRDAERYEWLRQHQLLAKINYMPTPSGEDLDAAIDAAMLAAKKETP